MRRLDILFRRFARHCEGATAVEFAILVPFVMLPIYGGVVELSEAVTVSRKVAHIGTTLADCLSRNDAISINDADALLKAAASQIAPYHRDHLKLTMSIVNVSTAGQMVGWSRAYQTEPLAADAPSPVVLPKAIASPGAGVVVVRVEYDFKAPFSDLFQHLTGVSTYHYDSTYVQRPRGGKTIALQSYQRP